VVVVFAWSNFHACGFVLVLDLKTAIIKTMKNVYIKAAHVV